MLVTLFSILFHSASQTYSDRSRSAKTHRLLFSPSLFLKSEKGASSKSPSTGSVLASASGDPPASAGRATSHVETQTPSSPCGLPRPSPGAAGTVSAVTPSSAKLSKAEVYSHFADKHGPRCRAGGSDSVLKVLSSVWPSQNPLHGFTASLLIAS